MLLVTQAAIREGKEPVTGRDFFKLVFRGQNGATAFEDVMKEIIEGCTENSAFWPFVIALANQMQNGGRALAQLEVDVFSVDSHKNNKLSGENNT